MAEFKTTINATWNGGLVDSGTLQGERLKTKIAIPQVSGGSGNGADSKEFLIASASTCYLASIVFLLERRNLPVKHLSINTEATKSTSHWYIVHCPEIVLSKEATEEQIQSAKKVLKGADRGCQIGNLLKQAGVVIEVQGNVSLR